MSYRTLKRLLGETSLERKCRFLFGGGLMLLITGSFYLYARLNASLIYEQNRSTGRILIAPILLEEHWKHTEEQRSQDAKQRAAELIDDFTTSLKPKDLSDLHWRVVMADPTKAGGRYRPDDEHGYDALQELSGGAEEVIKIDRGGGWYHYYGRVEAAESCLGCHRERQPTLEAGELMGMVKVSIPLDRTEDALAWNNAALLATAIVTAFLAMLAAYAIVRYVIVKPVLHLKDVSDEIARGTLDLRADIRTGDEFEELSHAFNRMLRHLTTVQDELREANDSLEKQADELAQANLRLYETNKLKDEFLATMSHELRTPLNSILGFSDVLAGASNITDKQARFVGNIQKSGRDLMALINDLLDLAKIESGKMEVQPAELLAADIVERQVAALSPLAEKKNIEVSTVIEPDLPRIWQDPGKLQQILNNLLSNAIKFTPEGGRVRVSARLADGESFDKLRPEFELSVEDTGIGIPLEDQATIFEKFRQGRGAPGQKDAMTREYGGTGLGLSIVKELSKLLGGEVTLESEFGKGSAFTVRLPVHYQPSDEKPERDPLQDSSFNIRRRPMRAIRVPDTGGGEDAA